MATPEYNAWTCMRQRCRNEKHKDYYLYGARGITFHPRWDSFENFLADMGVRPSPRHSLDRIDNDGNYGPGNCRWATAVEQTSNRRSNVWVTLPDGRRLTAKQWAAETGANYNTVTARLRRERRNMALMAA